MHELGCGLHSARALARVVGWRYQRPEDRLNEGLRQILRALFLRYMGRHEERRPVVDVEELRLPSQVMLRGDCLGWVFRPKAKGRVRVPSSPNKLLEPFLGLSDADAPRILDFARSWGTLTPCRHGLPTSHGPIMAQASVFSSPT